MKSLIVLLILLGLSSTPALVDGIEIIQLHNILAEEVIPIIKPMLGANDTISGQGVQLFIRTSADNLMQIRQMISKLDRPAKLLLITVFQGEEYELRSLAVSGNIRYQDRHGEIGFGRSKPSSGDAGVNYSTQNTSLGIQALSTKRQLSQHPIYQLHITDGSQGYIETGQAIPYFAAGHWHQGTGRPNNAIAGAVTYQEIHSGFYVLPRVHGEHVTLTVSPYQEGKSLLQSGAYQTSGATTRITGPLGQWLLIGGMHEQHQLAQNDLTRVVSVNGRESQRIWIKAELVE